MDAGVILWALPPALAAWLDDGPSCCLVESDQPRFGRFVELCSDAPCDTRLTGVTAGVTLGDRVREVVEQAPGPIESHADVTGLIVAALRNCRLHLVRRSRVPLCATSPLRPQGAVGSHGVQLAGLDALPPPGSSPRLWSGPGSRLPALRRELYDRVGVRPPPAQRYL